MSQKQKTFAHPAISRFDDFDRFADATRGWSLDFRQLDRGPLAADFFQVRSQESILLRVRFSRALDQRGSPPPGFLTFGILDDGVSGVRWCGREATDRTLLAFDTRSGFDAVSRPGFGAYTYSVAEERLARVAEMLEFPRFERRLGAARTFAASPISRFAELRGRLRVLSDAIEKDAALAENAWFQDELDFELPWQLLFVIASASADPRRGSARSRRVALRKAQAFIRDNLSLPPTVRQVCEHTGVSWRTLDYAFREHFDVTPRAYLKAVRLDEARRELRSGTCATVAEAANHCGFWHMGDFAAGYRSQFTELPSETLRRSAR